MNKLSFLNTILECLYQGTIPDKVDGIDIKQGISNITMEILDENCIDPLRFDYMNKIIMISNILYNNTSRDILPLEDGVYDLLLVRYMQVDPSYQIGAPVINFIDNPISMAVEEVQEPFTIIDKEDFLYDAEILRQKIAPIERDAVPAFYFSDDRYENERIVSKRLNTSTQMFPELVGTLDKAKYVLNVQAEEKGVLGDSNVTVLERDFFGKHIMQGIIDPNKTYQMVLELKYDGISIVAECNSKIITAFTRGDVNDGVASDMTPILQGYPFPDLIGKLADVTDMGGILKTTSIGVKFEAIMTNSNLQKFNELKGKDYKNGRTAIVGLFSSSDAYKYRDLITLVPLESNMGHKDKLLFNDRVLDINFLNKYYTTDEYLRYVVIEGDYKYLLFQIKKFVEEAEFLRPYLPFMYDGVVVSYLDPDIRERLGRVNSVNQYSIAVKFNPLKKQTIFRGYQFTVGQSGTITPMIYYDPVEFYGTIHPKSTGHSYERFKQLNLRVGDVIDVEYTNDVMPYVTKPDNEYNRNNTNPIVEFPTHCPCCESVLEVSESGKSAYCNNKSCPGRLTAMLVNMMKKLNLKDFAEANLLELGAKSLNEMLNTTMEDLNKTTFGPKTKEMFLERMNQLKTEPIYDYRIVGALGFTGIAQSTWKTIFEYYSLAEILSMSDEERYSNLIQIKNIGKATVETINEELPYFKNDLDTILMMSNIMTSKYAPKGKKIRFTGVRDSSLVEEVTKMGHDIGEGTVTKDTDYLIVPNLSYNGKKVDNANKYGIKILSLDEFKNNLSMYL